MPKTLKDFLEVYKPKSPDEQKFVDKHVVIKHKDRNGNGDDVFNGNTKYIKRKEERKGYDVGEDEKVYEALKGDQHKIDANKNGKVDAHDFHLLRKRKKVAEEVEDLDELSQKMVRAYRDKARDDKESAEDDREYYKAHDDNTDDEDKKIRKRTAGIKMAGSKIHGGAKVKVAEDIDLEDLLGEALDLLNSIDEKTLTPAEMKKREEVVKAIKRDDPKMDKSMAYAVATKTAKRVAEGTMPTADEPTEANKKTAQKIRDMMAKEKKPVKEETEELDESAKIAAHLIKRYGDNVRKSHVVSAANDFGVDASKLAKAVRTKLGKTSLAEEEQIDEISATTKDAYAQKAGKQLTGLFKKSGTDADAARKYYNRKNTVRKIANEETEELDELSKDKLLNYMDKASDARGHRNLSTKKVDNRYAGVKKASDKLATEEVEGIDEISADMADRYLKGKRERDWKRSDDGSYSVPTNARPQDTRRKNIDARGTSLAIKSIRRLRNTVAKEEVEQVDEISKAMAGRYINKAKNSIDLTAWRQGYKEAGAGSPSKHMEKKLSKRHKGIETAVSKLTKEDSEQIDELSKATLKSYGNKASDQVRDYVTDKPTSFKASMNNMKREKGLQSLQKRKTNEEAEQIDELSKATMGRYINKAATKMGSQGVTAGLKIAADEKSSKNFKDMGKREKGIKLAVNKLTKEDIINRAVEKYVPEDIKFTPEERLLKRINGLSEAHVQTLLSLFEDLNKDNQNKMIETVETREGINQILNFVLENRGE